MKDHPIRPDGPRRPDLVVFDVNETLSDMSPLAVRFEEVGAPSLMAQTWFAELLRDGFALTVSGMAEPFAGLAAETLRLKLNGRDRNRDLDEAVEHVLSGFAGLALHPDVAEGLHTLADLGVRLVTLSNGSAQVAETLLGQAGVRPLFERLLSVEEAGIWKPASGAYDHALAECGVDADDAKLVAVHPWDVNAAACAVLGTAWINRAEAGIRRTSQRRTFRGTQLKGRTQEAWTSWVPDVHRCGLVSWRRPCGCPRRRSRSRG